MAERNDRETEAYLARIRRTIAESTRLVEQADLRIRETDRLLESQGLTREQVLGMRFSDSQREAVNAELERRGLEPLEEESDDPGRWEETQISPQPATADFSEDLAERQKKFGMMMKPFQI